MTKENLVVYLEKNGEIILFDTLGCQRLINVEKKTNRLYYLEWSPRENTGEPREYITIQQAMVLIKVNKPNLFENLATD